MNGPDHYAKAEIAQDAAAAMQAARQPGPEYTVTEALLDALVHATLALAAATALEPSGAIDTEEPDYLAWRKVAGLPEVTP